jgi:spore maturation protein CgeB
MMAMDAVLARPDVEILRSGSCSLPPLVSIVTMAYDQTGCLSRCIRSVQGLHLRDYEHIIVTDNPPELVVREIAGLIADVDSDDLRISYANLKTRRSDWGIGCAAAGLRLARGRYVCFLLDRNAYLPGHFAGLLPVIENDSDIGFVYSSCLYDGRRILNSSQPGGGEIDLGQPLFRRSLFEQHFENELPFRGFGWDWRMIERLISLGVRFRHVDEPTFIYGLCRYPNFIPTNAIPCSEEESAPPPAPSAASRAVLRGSRPQQTQVQSVARPPSPAVRNPVPAPLPMPAPLPQGPAHREVFSGWRNLPHDLAAFRDFHAGETMLVCGCGTSLLNVVAPERFPTIGVNDVGRLLNPDYLLVVNPPGQFSGNRFTFVEKSQARAIFTQLDLGISHPHIVRFRLGKRGGSDLSETDTLPYTRNSPYMAVCLAVHMGAKRIGLIGVDFTDHHFFGSTGRHPLAGELSVINREYAALAQTCHRMGVEVYNLSENSLLTAFPKMTPGDFAESSLTTKDSASATAGARVFFVNYKFLSCGDVFSDGLTNAADRLGALSASAYWDDASLPAKIDAFAPDLLFVVHGRKYSQRWNANLHKTPSAVWLLDEPYEVDDTSRFSSLFDTVYLNDPSTLGRHRNAHFLPVCYDPRIYNYRPEPRIHQVGFIGGANPAREVTLKELARRELLSYVVGGPWHDADLRRLCVSGNIPAAETANLYRQTRIVVNVFRTAHHFNREKIAAVSMNPRIYEALACGALVISERRPEIEELCPEMPVFDTREEMIGIVESLLADPLRMDLVRKACIRRLSCHTYSDRLGTVLARTLGRTTSVSESKPVVDVAAPATVSTPNARAPVAALNENLTPFTAMPRRNLIYHIWPVRGEMWRWNIEQLKTRLDLFNGRRVIGITHDSRTEDPAMIQEALAGHGCEFLVAPNQACGEVVSFPKMLQRIASDNENELTFYAHGKGVKYEPCVSPWVRRWAEANYQTTLDDWRLIRDHLERFAFTGSFRLTGRFRTHRNIGSWHYSGTFFWMRHARVFSRSNLDVPPFYWGVEAWPGKHFSVQEAGCLLFENPRPLPYDEQFWKSAEAEFARWQAERPPFDPPAGLDRPEAFDGFEWPRLEQHPAEFEWFLQRLIEAEPSRILTIGGMHGGVEWHIARRFRNLGRDVEITVVEVNPLPELFQSLEDARHRFDQKIILIEGESGSRQTRELLSGQYDAVFIDGDHTYRGSRSDFDLARSFHPRLIGLHDIVDSDWHAYSRCCVSRLWRELRNEYYCEENAKEDWGGIGLVWPTRPFSRHERNSADDPNSRISREGLR